MPITCGAANNLPERGRIGIFNRSYYEEVLVVRVHPEYLQAQKLPPALVGKDLWKVRYEDIRTSSATSPTTGLLSGRSSCTCRARNRSGAFSTASRTGEELEVRGR